MIQPVFENIQGALLAQFESATSSIKIIMAWFTDQQLLDMLIFKANKGVHIELILLDHQSNRKKEWEASNEGIQQFERFKLNLNQLRAANASVTLIDAEAEFFMHSKFCIIDNVTVITGSYNWTYPAQRNIENIVIITDKDIAVQFDNEFQRIRDKKHEILLRLAMFPRCPVCGKLAVKIRIYDYYGKTSDYYEDTKDVLFCPDDPAGHLQVLTDAEAWPFELGETIRNIYEEIDLQEEQDENIKVSKQQHDQRLTNALARYFGSANDLFITDPNQIFVVLKRSHDPATEGETPVFKVIWSNELFKDHAELFVDWSVELDELLYW